MFNKKLTTEQIAQLIDAWEKSENGSLEQKLIEDLFLMTDTCLPAILDIERNDNQQGEQVEYLGVA